MMMMIWQRRYLISGRGQYEWWLWSSSSRIVHALVVGTKRVVMLVVEALGIGVIVVAVVVVYHTDYIVV